MPGRGRSPGGVKMTGRQGKEGSNSEGFSSKKEKRMAVPGVT